MFSVPISVAVLAVLKLLGVTLTAAQTAMVVGGVVILVKLAVAFGAVTLGTKVWEKVTGKKPAEPVAEPAKTEPAAPAD